MRLHENIEQLEDAIHNTYELLKIDPKFVEKDYWICQIRRIIETRGVQDKGFIIDKRYVDFEIFSGRVGVFLENISYFWRDKNGLCRCGAAPGCVV